MGVGVHNVNEGSAAEKQGVRAGAIVIELNGKSVVGQTKRAVIDAIKESGFPLTLRFDMSKAETAAPPSKPASPPPKAGAPSLKEVSRPARRPVRRLARRRSAAGPPPGPRRPTARSAAGPPAEAV